MARTMSELEATVNAACARLNVLRADIAAKTRRVVGLETELVHIRNENETLVAVEARTHIMALSGGAARQSQSMFALPRAGSVAALGRARAAGATGGGNDGGLGVRPDGASIDVSRPAAAESKAGDDSDAETATVDEASGRGAATAMTVALFTRGRLLPSQSASQLVKMRATGVRGASRQHLPRGAATPVLRGTASAAAGRSASAHSIVQTGVGSPAYSASPDCQASHPGLLAAAVAAAHDGQALVDAGGSFLGASQSLFRGMGNAGVLTASPAATTSALEYMRLLDASDEIGPTLAAAGGPGAASSTTSPLPGRGAARNDKPALPPLVALLSPDSTSTSPVPLGHVASSSMSPADARSAPSPVRRRCISASSSSTRHSLSRTAFALVESGGGSTVPAHPLGAALTAALVASSPSTDAVTGGAAAITVSPKAAGESACALAIRDASGAASGAAGVPAASITLTTAQAQAVERMRYLRRAIDAVKASMARTEFKRRQHAFVAARLRGTACAFDRHMKGLDDAIHAARKELSDVAGYLRLLEASRDAAAGELSRSQQRLIDDKAARQRDVEDRKVELDRAWRMDEWRRKRAAVRAEMRAKLEGDLSQAQERELVARASECRAAIKALREAHADRVSRAATLQEAFMRVRAATGIQTLERMAERLAGGELVTAALAADKAEAQSNLAALQQQLQRARLEHAAATTMVNDVGAGSCVDAAAEGSAGLLRAADGEPLTETATGASNMPHTPWRERRAALLLRLSNARDDASRGDAAVDSLAEALLTVQTSAVSVATLLQPFKGILSPHMTDADHRNDTDAALDGGRLEAATGDAACVGASTQHLLERIERALSASSAALRARIQDVLTACAAVRAVPPSGDDGTAGDGEDGHTFITALASADAEIATTTSLSPSDLLRAFVQQRLQESPQASLVPPSAASAVQARDGDRVSVNSGCHALSAADAVLTALASPASMLNELSLASVHMMAEGVLEHRTACTAVDAAPSPANTVDASPRSRSPTRHISPVLASLLSEHDTSLAELTRPLSESVAAGTPADRRTDPDQLRRVPSKSKEPAVPSLGRTVSRSRRRSSLELAGASGGRSAASTGVLASGLSSPPISAGGASPLSPSLVGAHNVRVAARRTSAASSSAAMQQRSRPASGGSASNSGLLSRRGSAMAASVASGYVAGAPNMAATVTGGGGSPLQSGVGPSSMPGASRSRAAAEVDGATPVDRQALKRRAAELVRTGAAGSMLAAAGDASARGPAAADSAATSERN